ncbi:MAG TPA: MFS transporter [Steroidobacteraceae bacterium]|nr:MFS transporter [Steroidobacteraceae bacterium]
MAQGETILVDELIDRQPLTGRNYFILGVLLLALTCDGFDLQLVAFAAPRIAKAWGIAPEALKFAQVANLLGMMFGAMLLGNLGDRLGRKRVIVTGTLLYGLTAFACLLAHTPQQLSLIRFCTGLGLGGVLPNVIALAAEISPVAQRARLTSIPIIGMSLGSGLPAVVAAWLVPHFGWQALFVAGGIVPVAVAVTVMALLPESLLFLVFRDGDRATIAARVRELDPRAPVDANFSLRGRLSASRGSIPDLFAGSLKFTTPLLWLMFACTLLSMHFLNSWISVILNKAGLSEVQTALTNGALHWGGTVAAVATVFVLGRMGLRWALLLLLLGFAGCLIIATTGFGAAPLLTTAVCMAGFGIIGCQGVLNAAAGLVYPVSCRPTGAGAALGIGRIGSLSGPLVGAWVLAQDWPSQRMFYVPLLPLAIAAAATLLLIARGVQLRGETAVTR